jgi:lipopolysaccharide transport system permease protein
MVTSEPARSVAISRLLIWRDLSARYRQSVVGYGWAFIKPLVSVLIFAMVFGGLAKLPSDGVPYPLFALAALIPWLYFSATLAGVSTSVTSGGHLLTKVYFPRLILPLASLGAGLVDLALQLLLMFAMMGWYGVAPGSPMLLLPFFVGFTVATALSFGLWLTALNVRYRDIGHAVPFLLQAWMWTSPVVYSSTLVPEKWRWLYSLNPLVGIIDGFRWCLLGTVAPDWLTLGTSVIMVTVVLLTGLIYFRHQEAAFADVI